MERGWLAIPFLVIVFFFSLPPLASNHAWLEKVHFGASFSNFILRLGIRANETHLVIYIKNISLLFSTPRNNIYIFIHRQTVSLYHTSSTWLDSHDASYSDYSGKFSLKFNCLFEFFPSHSFYLSDISTISYCAFIYTLQTDKYWPVYMQLLKTFFLLLIIFSTLLYANIFHILLLSHALLSA